ncbi:nuclear transport factor 2 family protein [Rhodococcus kronopolitis]|uniref:Nuclear transport factor 2 family protein n=1 Tax=Rhodococcus kronopolitis TaxID=1460226 RepID=A0ABV9FW99_9NOCA
MIIRKSLVVVAATLAAVGVASCSSDESSTADSTTTASATTEATTEAAADAPSTDALNATLVTFFDPAVPTADKVAVIVNGEKQAAVLEQFNGVLKGYPLTTEVTAVTPVDADTVKATATITGPHGGAPTDLTFDQVDGKWVISDTAVCTIFSMGRLTCVS